MDLAKFLVSRGLQPEVGTDGMVTSTWRDGDDIAIALLANVGQYAADDVLVELHTQQTYGADEIGAVLAAVNEWNNRHILSRARVSPVEVDRFAVVLDAWTVSADIGEDVIESLLDRTIAEMLSFWSDGTDHDTAR